MTFGAFSGGGDTIVVLVWRAVTKVSPLLSATGQSLRADCFTMVSAEPARLRQIGENRPMDAIDTTIITVARTDRFAVSIATDAAPERRVRRTARSFLGLSSLLP